MPHPVGCHCRWCVMSRRPDVSVQIRERMAGNPEYRRGKPVVSKGCRNCHKKRKIE